MISIMERFFINIEVHLIYFIIFLINKRMVKIFIAVLINDKIEVITLLVILYIRVCLWVDIKIKGG